MDKIWYRNPSTSKVIDFCCGDEKTNDQAEPTKALTFVAGMKKRMIKQNQQKSNAKKIN